MPNVTKSYTWNMRSNPNTKLMSILILLHCRPDTTKPPISNSTNTSNQCPNASETWRTPIFPILAHDDAVVEENLSKTSKSSLSFKIPLLKCNLKILEKPSEAYYIELSEIWETQNKETDPRKSKLSAEIEKMGHLRERDHFCIKKSETRIIWIANWNSIQIPYDWLKIMEPGCGRAERDLSVRGRVTWRCGVCVLEEAGQQVPNHGNLWKRLELLGTC